jgi:hypothetical protein
MHTTPPHIDFSASVTNHTSPTTLSPTHLAGTCGGQGNGCLTIKGKVLQFGTKVAVAMRTGPGAVWGKERIWCIDHAKNDGSTHQLDLNGDGDVHHDCGAGGTEQVHTEL